MKAYVRLCFTTADETTDSCVTHGDTTKWLIIINMIIFGKDIILIIVKGLKIIFIYEREGYKFLTAHPIELML